LTNKSKHALDAGMPDSRKSVEMPNSSASIVVQTGV